MWCGVLGPLLVRRADGEALEVTGPARRLLLAALISRAGSSVPAHALIEDVWGGVPPRSAPKTLQSHLVRLRDDLGRQEAQRVLVTDAIGYRLALDANELDTTAFEQSVAEARAAREPAAALGAYDAGLALWRGEPYEDFLDAPFAVSERVRLLELRGVAEEERTDVALSLGQAAELITGLEKRVANAPYRERSWAQLMLALYRAGRQADALGAFRRVAAILSDELGIDPGPALREMHSRILHQDPDLTALPTPTTGPVPPTARPEDLDRCPYLGLASYRDTDADVFVGRERLTAALVSQLADHRVVVVAGASGSGKSSVLRAGVLPALRAGALPGAAAWRMSVLSPAEISGASVGSLDLAVLDQAEELFTVLTASERATVIDVLEQFVQAGGRLLVAMRGDFYGRLVEVQPFGAYAEAATVLAGPLRPDELRRVIVEPAERVGLMPAEDLLEAVLDEMAGQTSALPLLSAALVRTWDNREGRTLTLAGYRRGGGIASAIEKSAEDCYSALDEPTRLAAHRLLVRLAEPEADGWTRRTVRRADLGTDASTAKALTALADARLVAVSADRVEVTHEALLEHWPRLRSWLDERLLAAGLVDHLASAARAWDEAGRPDSDLYRGARLQAALDWREDHPDETTPSEVAFLDASAAHARQELTDANERAAREARGRRRLRVIASALAAVVVIAAAAAVVATRERTSANRSARLARATALTADSRRLAALAANAPDSATSSLLAAAADTLQDSPEARGALLAAVERNSTALWRIQTAHRPQRLVTTANGRWLAYNDNRRQVKIIDLSTRKQAFDFPLRADVLDGITADGRQVVAFGGDSVADTEPIGRVSIVDVATGRRVRILTTAPDPHQAEPVMSEDNHWLAVVMPAGVSVWDADDWGRRPLSYRVPGGVNAIAVSAHAVAVERPDGSVQVRALPSLEVLGGMPAVSGVDPARPTGTLAVDPSGDEVLRGDPIDPKRVAVYRTADGPTGLIPLPSQSDGVGQAAFSPDGKDLALATEAGSVVVYSATSGELVESLPGESGPVHGLAWTGSQHPTGLYTDGLDSQVVSWSLSVQSRLFSESGPTMATPDRGETFGRWVFGLTPQFGSVPSSHMNLYTLNLDTGSYASWNADLKDNPNGQNQDGEFANQAVASFDGRVGLVSVNDQTGLNHVDIWDLVNHVRTGALQLPGDTYKHFVLGLQAAISPDGRTAYCAVDRDHVGVFELPSGRFIRQFPVDFAGADAERDVIIPWRFDPFGHLLVAGVDPGPYIPGNQFTLPGSKTDPPNQRLGVLDLATERLIGQVSLGDAETANVDWSPDGRTLALGTRDGALTTYDAKSLQQKASAGAVEPGFILTVSFAPDGRTVLVGGTSGDLSLFDAADLSRLGTRVSVGPTDWSYAWYDQAGDVIGFAHSNGGSGLRKFTFRLDRASLLATACQLAGADMTADQWRQYVGDRPFQSVCRSAN